MVLLLSNISFCQHILLAFDDSNVIYGGNTRSNENIYSEMQNSNFWIPTITNMHQEY